MNYQNETRKILDKYIPEDLPTEMLEELQSLIKKAQKEAVMGFEQFLVEQEAFTEKLVMDPYSYFYLSREELKENKEQYMEEQDEENN